MEHEENLKIQEGLVRYIIRYCLKLFEELVILERNLKPLKKRTRRLPAILTIRRLLN